MIFTIFYIAFWNNGDITYVSFSNRFFVQKIILISVNRCSLPYPVYPLGVTQLASALQKQGYETLIYDMQVETGELEASIRSFSPDCIGLSLRNIDDIQIHNTSYYVPLFTDTVERVRRICKAPVVLGGSGFSLFPARILALSGADFGVWGEGEAAFLALLSALATHGAHEHIPGLVYRKNGAVCVNPKTPCPAATIATLKRPQHLVDFYIQQSAMLNIQTQRGCPYTCCYCTYPLIEGSNTRYRGAEEICDEIAEAQALGAPYVYIVDSVFNTSQKHVVTLCEEMIRRKCTIKWGCFLRPRDIDQALMDLMARAGLSHIEFGTDSLCDPVLEAYGKAFTFDDIVKASNCAHRSGVNYAHFLITGGPAETEETIKKGFENSWHIKQAVFFSYIGMRIYPDTPLYYHAIREGAISADTDLLPPCFYVTPHVSEEKIFDLSNKFNSTRRNWVIGEYTPEKVKAMQMLRRMGVAGPLWEFLSK